MKQVTKRCLSLVMAIMLVFSLLSGLNTVSAASVQYVYGSDNVIKNWGARGTTATFLSPRATEFYADNNTSYADLAALNGASSIDSVPSSTMYQRLKTLMTDNHSYKTSYDATKKYYRYTDCQNSSDTAISSFYSGASIGPAWGQGSWNREHTWPNSKGLDGQDENDIMMLRPTATSENSSRGNTAYGQSSGYYDPNRESNGRLNLHGDVARICLYVYVRWGNTSYMWGKSGVMESMDVLLDWMEEDPVDTWELGRNDSVESITGTRNVFVDYPELAFLMFNQDIPADMPTPSGEGANNSVSYSITASSNNNSYGAVAVSGKTITATPVAGYVATGYQVVSGSATVTQNGNTFAVMHSSDCHIQILFTPKTQVSVKFMEDGTQAASETVYSGDTINLPSNQKALETGYSFLGWVSDTITETTVKPTTIYTAGTSYTVTANTTFYALYRRVDGDSGTEEVYQKVTTDPGDWSGTYLIVYEAGNCIMDGSLNDLDEENNNVEVTIANDTISAADGAGHTFEIAKSGSDYTIQSASGQYIGWTSSDSNGLETNTTGYANSITLGTSGNADIVSPAGAHLRFNKSSNQLRFRYYKTATYSNQQPISLYKLATMGTSYYATNMTPPCTHENTVNAPEVPARCTQTGTTAGVYCNDCATYISGHQTIPALGHNYVGAVTPPTSTAQGYTTYTCSRCSDFYIDDYVEMVYTVTFRDWNGTELSSGSYQLGASVTAPKNPTRPADKTYTYTFAGWDSKVVACDGDKVYTATYTANLILQAPTNLKATLYGHDDVKLTWKAGAAATKYYVYYRKKDASAWTKAGTTSGLSYSIPNLADNAKYEFRVISYKGSTKGPSTSVLSFSTTRNLSAPSKVTLKLYGYDDVKISWSKVKYATAYKVYFKATGDKGYKYYGTFTGTSAKRPDNADGKKYTFKVVPCITVNGGYYEDDSSKTATITTLKKVATPKVAKYSSSKIKVSWTNIAGESGYQISVSTSKTGTSIKVTYKTTSGKSKKISVKKGKTYYVKVRAYKTVDGKKIYAPWSAVKEYKLK